MIAKSKIAEKKVKRVEDLSVKGGRDCRSVEGLFVHPVRCTVGGRVSVPREEDISVSNNKVISKVIQ